MKLIKLNEFYSVGDSLLNSSIESEKGIRKEILEILKLNYGNKISLEIIKNKLNELKKEGTKTGILPTLEYDINNFNFFIEHREEIEELLSDTNWIDDNKNKWNSKMEILDIIVECVNYVIKYQSEKLLQEIFNG